MYNTGTISTTAGSNIVTGTGTVWSANINAGDILAVGASGKLYRVFSVDSSSQLMGI